MRVSPCTSCNCAPQAPGITPSICPPLPPLACRDVADGLRACVWLWFHAQLEKEFFPPPLVVTILRLLSHVIPTWKLVPQRDLADLGFKDPHKRYLVSTVALPLKFSSHLDRASALLRYHCLLECTGSAYAGLRYYFILEAVGILLGLACSAVGTRLCCSDISSEEAHGSSCGLLWNVNPSWRDSRMRVDLSRIALCCFLLRLRPTRWPMGSP